ncbi:hypothetical protein F0562_036141 [Nyssa sinensis]|uniref:RRM domain-containing protein n=1 Tax=Nyssa sinensis TaxID=561372 RepID=A0A5J5AGC2_9ASTE|nr:hypothetical protein F0562_036141 [Nyssa sinensis]
MHHQRLKQQQQQQQALMQQAALLQQQSMYHPGLLAPPQVTEPLLQEVFSSTGPVEGCKLIRKDKSSYGFIHYFDRRSAALAILSLNGRHLFGQPIKVNWAYASGQREDTSSHYNIFVGDLSPEVTDAMLFACFSVYPSCSRGFGFVSFRNQQDAQSAINDLTGKWLGSRQIRCNWAAKGAGANDDKQSSDAKSMVELSNGSSEDGKDTANNDAPENNPQYTTVYVTQPDLHRHFHALGAGVIEEVRVQRDKGFGFVRYSTHAEAALAIQMGNTQSLLCGKQIKQSQPQPAFTQIVQQSQVQVQHQPHLLQQQLQHQHSFTNQQQQQAAASQQQLLDHQQVSSVVSALSQFASSAQAQSPSLQAISVCLYL